MSPPTNSWHNPLGLASATVVSLHCITISAPVINIFCTTDCKAARIETQTLALGNVKQMSFMSFPIACMRMKPDQAP